MEDMMFEQLKPHTEWYLDDNVFTENDIKKWPNACHLRHYKERYNALRVELQ
jgi:hypothetical protein